MTTLRDDFLPAAGFDPTMGLSEVGLDLFACPTCGTRYRRSIDRGDVWRDHDRYFFAKLEVLAPAFGCDRCSGADAATAWAAARTRHLHSLIDESHFGIAITACACGQPFAKVFTERIDWVNSEDDQTWLAVPLRPEEVAQLTACPAADLERRLVGFAQGRRFVAHTFPTGGELSTRWREGGFAIGSHD